MVEGGREDGSGLRAERCAELFDEREEGGRVEGEGCAAAGVRGVRVGHGGELGAGQVVAVHGEEGRELGGGAEGRVGGFVEGVEGLGDFGCEGCFACGRILSAFVLFLGGTWRVQLGRV